MPRPTDKNTLLEFSQKNFDLLLKYINSRSEPEQMNEFPTGTMNRNIRDVLAHLYHWHLMMKDWYVVGMEGQKPDIPAKGYTWKTVPQLNHKIWQDYQNVSLQEIRESLENSHKEMMQLIVNHSNEELFEKKRYAWTGTTSLGAYFIGATSSHYDWALKLISKAFKKMGST